MAKQTAEEKRRDELIGELLKEYDGPDSFWGESGLFADLKKRIVKRTFDVEMDNHLGYSKHDPKGNNSGNSIQQRHIAFRVGDLGNLVIPQFQKLKLDRLGPIIKSLV